MNVHVLGAAEAHAAAQVIRSGWLAQGPEVAAFELEFAARVGAAHACAVSSGAAAFHLALLAVGVVAGDEVLLPANAHSVCISAVLRCGAVPVYAALDETSDNMKPEAVAAAITSRTRALLCSHNHGMPCDLTRILPIADAAGVAVVEDAVAAVGSQILLSGRWSVVGAPHGTVACFGFHPGSVISPGGGGVITTSRPEIDQAFRTWREHEPLRLDDRACGASPGMAHNATAYDYRLSDIQGAIGREQLKRLDSIVAARRALAARYRIFLKDIEVGCPEEPLWARSNWQSYCITLPGDVSRDAVMEDMAKQGVATRRGALNLHACEGAPPTATTNGSNGGRRTSSLQDLRLLLPLYPSMSERLQRRVASALATSIASTRSFQ